MLVTIHKYIKQNKILYMIMMLFAVINLTACGKATLIRADSSLENANPMRNISVLGAARVVWPRMNGKTPVIGLAVSKKALDRILPIISDSIKDRGYTLNYAKAAGVAYSDYSYSENWVYENYETQADQTKKWKTGKKKVAYVYPEIESNAELSAAVQNVFISIDEARSGTILSGFDFESADLKAIQKAVGGDTLCFVDIYATKYTTNRKVGSIAADVGIALLTGVTTNNKLKEHVVTGLICALPETGKVIWAHARRSGGDATIANAGYVRAVLRYFPKVASPLSNDCVPWKEIETGYACKKKKKNKSKEKGAVAQNNS